MFQHADRPFVNSFGTIAPIPVSKNRSRRVHTSIAVQPQQILHRNKSDPEVDPAHRWAIASAAMATSIGIVGSGVSGLHLGLYLCEHDVPVTMYTDKEPDATLQDSVEALHIAEAIWQSAQSGAEVAVEHGK